MKKREAARKAAATRRHKRMEKLGETYRRALHQQTLREEQRNQMIDVEGSSDDGCTPEDGFVALLRETVSLQAFPLGILPQQFLV